MVVESEHISNFVPMSPKARTYEIEGYDCPYCGTRNEKRFLRDGRWMSCKNCNQIYDVRMKLKRIHNIGYSEKAIFCHKCEQLIFGYFKIIDGYRLCSTCCPKPKKKTAKKTNAKKSIKKTKGGH